MSKMILFFVLLISLPSFAQDKKGNNNFYVRFGNIKTTTTTAAQILALPKLEVTEPGIVVKHFSLSLRTPGGDIFGPYFNNSSELTDEEIRVIKKVRGQSIKLVIEDIKVLVPDGMTRSLSDFILTYSN